MPKKRKKQLQAAPKGSAAESGLTAADLERRRFDVRLVDSVLQYVTAASEHDKASLPTIAGIHLSWLREHLKPLARLARVKATEAVLGELSVDDCATAEQMWGGFFQLWFGLSLSTDPRTKQRLTTLTPHAPSEPLGFVKGREWLDLELGRLWIVEHFRVTNDGISRFSVPYLSTASRCIAYAIATLMENRWGLADRVKACPHRPDPQEGFHVFLDFRIREDGNLMDGAAMKYCCKAHENAAAQRRSNERKQKLARIAK